MAATARALESDVAGLHQQLRKRQADFVDKQRRDDLDLDRLVDAARKERDALLRLLREHRGGSSFGSRRGASCGGGGGVAPRGSSSSNSSSQRAALADHS